MINTTFTPPPHLRHPAVQTLLASIRLRKLGANPMLEMSRAHVLDAGERQGLVFQVDQDDVPDGGHGIFPKFSVAYHHGPGKATTLTGTKRGQRTDQFSLSLSVSGQPSLSM